MQNGDLKPVKPNQVESSTVCSPVLTAGGEKDQYYCLWFIPIKSYTSVFLLSAEMLIS